MTNIIEYPRLVALDILPINECWWYISSSFLNGFINQVDILKAYVLARYESWNSITDEHNNRTKQKVFDLFGNWNEYPHDNLGNFGDDILIIAGIDQEYNKTNDRTVLLKPRNYIFRNAKDKESHDELIISNENKENLYYFFWFDCDVSDCAIGRFYTEDAREKVIDSFSKYVLNYNEDRYRNEYTDEYEDHKELPVTSFTGWKYF